MNDSKLIHLCADDFGLSPGISSGIMQLARLQRLSAVGCMVNTPYFQSEVQALIALNNHIQIGLHFNLTEGQLLSDANLPCFSLRALLIKSHLGLIDPSLIKREFNQQLDAFTEAVGRLPDFIDGHQHVHQFPVIRPMILDVYETRLRQNGTSIRSTYPILTSKQHALKSRVLVMTGGKALQKQLSVLDIPHNSFFSGVYDFAKNTDYRSLFRQWLALAKSNTLIMCHPGESESFDDPIAATRSKELVYFLSDDFVNDCASFGAQLATGPKL